MVAVVAFLSPMSCSRSLSRVRLRRDAERLPRVSRGRGAFLRERRRHVRNAVTTTTRGKAKKAKATLFFPHERTGGRTCMDGWSDGWTDERMSATQSLRERADERVSGRAAGRLDDKRERAWQHWQRGTGEDLYPDPTRFGSATLVVVASPRDHMTRTTRSSISTRYSADIGPISSGVSVSVRAAL